MPKTAHASVMLFQFLNVNEIVLHACEAENIAANAITGCGAGETPEANKGRQAFCQAAPTRG
jgi:hypothetical protein